MPSWIFFEVLVPVAFLVLLAGTIVLWMRTKRGAVFVQLIASSLVCLFLGLETLARCLDGAGRSHLYDFIRRPEVQTIGQIALVIGFVAFPVGFLWYALTSKRI